MGTHVLEHQAWRFGATCDLSAWRRRSVKKPQVVYISAHHPEYPRRVPILKRCPLRQTTEVINPTNFHVDAPLVLAPLGGRSWGFPLTYQTTPTTSSTNVLLVNGQDDALRRFG